MNLLTIIVIIIFAVSILHGYRKGFIKSLASMVSIILSIVLVNMATPYVTEFLKTQTPVYDYILEKCKETFDMTAAGAKSGTSGKTRTESGTSGKTEPESGAKAGTGNLGAAGKEQAAEETKSGTDTSGQSGDTAWQEEWINNLKIPQALQNLLKENNTPECYREIAAESFSEYVPKYMAGLILSLVSFVVTWILVISFIWLAVMTLDVIASLPVLRGINQVLGLALGFFQGLIIVWIAFLIITIFSSSDIGKQLMKMISESPVLSRLYDTNLLLDFLQDTVKTLL